LSFVPAVGLSGERNEEQIGGMVVVVDAGRWRRPESATTAHTQTLGAAHVTTS
jgi:hypothetical protein